MKVWINGHQPPPMSVFLTAVDIISNPPPDVARAQAVATRERARAICDAVVDGRLAAAAVGRRRTSALAFLQAAFEPSDGAAMVAAAVSAAVSATGADMATLQIAEPEGLLLVAECGFDAPFLDYFSASSTRARRAARRGSAGSGSSSATWRRTRSSPARKPARSCSTAGSRAVQSTPLIGPSGILVGMLSTHYDHLGGRASARSTSSIISPGAPRSGWTGALEPSSPRARAGRRGEAEHQAPERRADVEDRHVGHRDQEADQRAELNAPPNETVNAVCSTRSMARPASVAMNAGGVASSSRVKNGASRPKASASTPRRAPRCTAGALARAGEDGVHRPGEAGRDRAEQRRSASSRRRRPAVIALIGGSWPAAVSTAMPCAVLHDQHRDRERNHELDHRAPGKHAACRSWARRRRRARPPAAGRRRAARSRPRPTTSAPISGGTSATASRSVEREERRRHRQRDPQAVAEGVHQTEAEAQEHARHHRHHDRHRHRLHRAPHPAREARAPACSTPVTRNAPITSREAQVAERRADQHRAGNAPQEDERLPVERAEGDAEQPVDEERGEDPRGDVGLRERPPRAPTERMIATGPVQAKEKCHHRVRRIEPAEIGEPSVGAGDGSNGGFERHVVVWRRLKSPAWRAAAAS